MSALPLHSVDLLLESMERVRELLNEAQARDIPEACSATLATATVNGQPSIRTIYVASVHDLGISFFANAQSGKGQQIAANPKVALCLFWAELNQQVTIEGEIQTLHAEEADAIWHQRSPESRLLACTADQGVLPRAEGILQAQRDLFQGNASMEALPRPAEWEGMLLHPSRVEFWNADADHSYKRELYARSPDHRWHLITDQN